MPYIRTEANTWIEVAKPLEWSHTTAQRNALSNVPNGRIIYHSTLDRFEQWDGSTWNPIIVNVSLESLTVSGNAEISGTTTLSGRLSISSYIESFRNQQAATIALDPRNESAVRDYVTANRTITLPSGLASSTVWSVSLFLEQQATARAFTWDSKIRWRDGEVPDLSAPTAQSVDEFSFRTYNGGTIWLGTYVGRFPSAGSGSASV